MYVNLIQEYDEVWSKNIQSEKFRFNNSQWLEMVDSHRSEDDAILYGDDHPDGNIYLQDADDLYRPDLYYGTQGFTVLLYIVKILYFHFSREALGG